MRKGRARSEPNLNNFNAVTSSYRNRFVATLIACPVALASQRTLPVFLLFLLLAVVCLFVCVVGRPNIAFCAEQLCRKARFARRK